EISAGAEATSGARDDDGRFRLHVLHVIAQLVGHLAAVRVQPFRAIERQPQRVAAPLDLDVGHECSRWSTVTLTISVATRPDKVSGGRQRRRVGRRSRPSSVSSSNCFAMVWRECRPAGLYQRWLQFIMPTMPSITSRGSRSSRNSLLATPSMMI